MFCCIRVRRWCLGVETSETGVFVAVTNNAIEFWEAVSYPFILAIFLVNAIVRLVLL